VNNLGLLAFSTPPSWYLNNISAQKAPCPAGFLTPQNWYLINTPIKVSGILLTP
jgi:hypothetical protein